ncbi:hypothetical protein Tco_0847251, partial [Tanacetum coccineum]
MTRLNQHEKALAITALKDELRKLKGKALVDNNVSNHPSDPELHQVNVEPITPKLLNKRTTHSAYIKHSQEEAAVLSSLFFVEGCQNFLAASCVRRVALKFHQRVALFLFVPPGTSLSTTIAQDAPLTSASSSTSGIHTPVQHQEIAEEPIQEDTPIIHDVLPPSHNLVTGDPGSAQSSSGNVNAAEPNQVNYPPDHLRRWTKDHPLDN